VLLVALLAFLIAGAAIFQMNLIMLFSSTIGWQHPHCRASERMIEPSQTAANCMGSPAVTLISLTFLHYKTRVNFWFSGEL
jgi:hypothetical protein